MSLHHTPSLDDSQRTVPLHSLVDQLSEAIHTATAYHLITEKEKMQLQDLYYLLDRFPYRQNGQAGARMAEPEQDHASVLVVSPNGQGHYTTINDALRKASPHTRILVQPGLYQETLVLEQSVEIVGDGPVQEIILENSSATCLRMQADKAVVRGLTIRSRVRAPSEKSFAVDIPYGQLILEDCDITSELHTCIAIHGPMSNPIIRRCRIHHGKEGGIFVYEQGAGIIEDCDICHNELSGVAIKQGGNPFLRRCRIHSGEASGIYVYEQGAGIIDDCDIYDNALSGIAIKQGGSPLLRRCRIHDGEASGVFVYEYGAGIIDGCEIFGNALSGVAIKQRGNPVIRRCRINRNAFQAIRVYNDGSGTIEDNDLTANRQGAWYIETGCFVKCSRNTE